MARARASEEVLAMEVDITQAFPFVSPACPGPSHGHVISVVWDDTCTCSSSTSGVVSSELEDWTESASDEMEAGEYNNEAGEYNYEAGEYSSEAGEYNNEAGEYNEGNEAGEEKIGKDDEDWGVGWGVVCY